MFYAFVFLGVNLQYLKDTHFICEMVNDILMVLLAGAVHWDAAKKYREKYVTS